MVSKEALVYLRNVWGYSDPVMVDEGTLRDLRENAQNGYRLDAELVNAIDRGHRVRPGDEDTGL